jgi:uncharacterized protein
VQKCAPYDAQGAAMLVNLSDVLTSQGKVLQQNVPFEPDRFKSTLGSFRITEKSDINFTASNIGTDKARIEGKVQFTFDTRCDRCLTEVPTELDISFERVVVSPDAEIDEDDEESRQYMEGYQLNLDELVQNEILVNWPVKILCKEDCKGICPKCGQNLNTGDCGCDTFVPDPRMAVLKDIFESNKEV